MVIILLASDLLTSLISARSAIASTSAIGIPSFSDIFVMRFIWASEAGNDSFTSFINPINSLKFVLNKLKKDKIKLNKNFYVFTGSTVGVVPILGKGFYKGKIEKFGSVKTKII